MVLETSHHTTHYAEHPGAVTLPITSEQRQAAQRFADLCPFAEKAQQIKRNTLAVCAVNAYLRMMDIKTDIAASDSWNPMMQMMSDVADLSVPGVGSLSCRAMSPAEEACYVPPEVWNERAGYIAVVIDEAAHSATLLGFTPSVSDHINAEERVAIAQFSPIEALLDHIHTLKSQTQSAPLTDTVQSAITQLGQWLDGAFTNGWQATSELFNPPQTSFAFRSASASDAISAPSIRRAKAIRLESGSSAAATQLVLVIHISPTAENVSDIILQVHPLGGASRLGEGISLSIFDDDNNLVRSATSRAIDNYIQLQVVGEPNERFSVQIQHENAVFKEQFEI